MTRSSGGTLPVSMDVAEKRLGVSKGVYSFTLPLGATINMDGTAIYQGVCVLFIGFAVGAPLDFSQQLTVILTAVLASIGTAGVPGSGAIMLMMVLNSVGLSVEPGHGGGHGLLHDLRHRRAARHGAHCCERHRRPHRDLRGGQGRRVKSMTPAGGMRRRRTGKSATCTP